MSVWLITGCSTGIGREIATVALEQGHQVAVTARDEARVGDFVERFGARALPLRLDVTDKTQCADAVARTENAFGRVDVLVNNAGYGYLAAIEEGEESEVRAMFETNFFGAVSMIKAALPGMRARRSGYIVNISSMAGLVANPGTGFYSASKFALEGLTEALSRELTPFGIRVSLIEPGPFRTDWAGRSMKQVSTPIDAYADSVGQRRAFIKSMHGRMPGDPRRAAEAIVSLEKLASPPLRLLLGKPVLDMMRGKLREIEQTLEEWESVTLGADYPPA
jgi:NAD(P)-dependent dehydrogenase (short-subunit alcohol dehydrogenase family)